MDHTRSVTASLASVRLRYRDTGAASPLSDGSSMAMSETGGASAVQAAAYRAYYVRVIVPVGHGDRPVLHFEVCPAAQAVVPVIDTRFVGRTAVLIGAAPPAVGHPGIGPVQCGDGQIHQCFHPNHVLIQEIHVLFVFFRYWLFRWFRLWFFLLRFFLLRFFRFRFFLLCGLVFGCSFLLSQFGQIRCCRADLYHGHGIVPQPFPIFVIDTGKRACIPVQEFRNRGQCIQLLIHQRADACRCVCVHRSVSFSLKKSEYVSPENPARTRPGPVVSGLPNTGVLRYSPVSVLREQSGPGRPGFPV
nr:MAG TPA: hypothetical protein [Caudoviricetes sp.]